MGNVSRLNGVGVMQELLENYFAEKNQTFFGLLNQIFTSGLTWARN